MANLIGTAPNQVPTNADLGRLAFIDSLRPQDVGALAQSFADVWTQGKKDVLTIINVGPTRTYTSIQAAVYSLEGKNIKGTVKIKVDDGTYNMGSGLWIEGFYASSNMSKVIIEGNVSNPQNCVLQFAKDGDNLVHGVVCQHYSGHLQFSGFRLVGDSTTALANNYRGVIVRNKASFWSQNNSLMIDGFNVGFEAHSRSYAYIRYVRIVNCLYGITAGSSSLVEADYGTITGVGVKYNNTDVGHGVYASSGSTISVTGATISATNQGANASDCGQTYVTNATITNCRRNIAAYTAGVVAGDGATITTSTERLATAANNGIINISNCTLNGIDKTPNGVFATHGSQITAYNCTVKNCLTGYHAEHLSEIRAEGSGGTGKLVNNTTNYNSTSGTVNSSGGYIFVA